jgi:hypothetical protein
MRISHPPSTCYNKAQQALTLMNSYLLSVFLHILLSSLEDFLALSSSLGLGLQNNQKLKIDV